MGNTMHVNSSLIFWFLGQLVKHAMQCKVWNMLCTCSMHVHSVLLNPTLIQSQHTVTKGSIVALLRWVVWCLYINELYILIFLQGILYQAGDIVSIEDIDGDLYYAQLRGFMQDQYAQKTAVITWLIPVVPRPSHFDPVLFLPGKSKEVMHKRRNENKISHKSKLEQLCGYAKYNSHTGNLFLKT